MQAEFNIQFYGYSARNHEEFVLCSVSVIIPKYTTYDKSTPNTRPPSVSLQGIEVQVSVILPMPVDVGKHSLLRLLVLKLQQFCN